MRLITSTDIMGHMARWAVQLHPYHEPPGLFEVCKVIRDRAAANFRDGVLDLPMRWFVDCRDLRSWLHEVLDHQPEVIAWNRPRSGHTQPFVVTSRFGGPAPEHDFIDIDALFLNIANSAWRDAEESDDRRQPPRPEDLALPHHVSTTGLSWPGPVHVHSDWPGYG